MDLLHQLNFKKQIFFEKNKIFSILKYEIKYCSIKKELHDWRISGNTHRECSKNYVPTAWAAWKWASQAFFMQ